MSQTSPLPRRSPLTGGWILVVGVMVLCVTGTLLTVRNYRSRVFSSKEATVLLAQWPEPRISVELPPDQVAQIRPGMIARITVGTDTGVLPGVVVSADATSRPAVVIVRLGSDTDRLGVTLPVAGKSTTQGRNLKDPRELKDLKAGTRCSVTIDTTIPVPESSPGSEPRR